MGKRDIKAQVRVRQLFTKIERSANATIQGVNVSDFDGHAFLVDCGAHTSGTGYKVTLQHRDGSDSWADIPDAQLEGKTNEFSVAVGDADSQIYVGYTGNKSQIGAVLTREGTGVMVVGVSVIEGYPGQFPVNG